MNDLCPGHVGLERREDLAIGKRGYDQRWLDYQHEIALRHTSIKKNTTDGAASTPYVPFSDIIAFSAVMNQTIKPFLATKGHAAREVDAMHDAWCRALQLQLALWAKTYGHLPDGRSEW